VSNTAVNGLPVGSDSNTGTAQAPFLTVQRALSAASGQPSPTIIVNSGTYSPSSGSWQVPNSVTITALVPTSLSSASGTILTQASGASTVLEFTNSTGAATLALNGVAMVGSTTTQLVKVDTSTAMNYVSLNGVGFFFGSGSGLAEGTNGKFMLTANNVGCVGTVTGSCFDINSHAAGNVTVNGMAANVTQLGDISYGALLDFVATTPGWTASISNVSGTVTAGSSVRDYHAIRIFNSPNASITNVGTAAANFVMQASNSNANCTPFLISNDPSNPIEADNPVVAYNYVTQDCVGGGHSSILIVSDGDPGPSLRDLVKHARIHNEYDTAGSSTTIASNIEGPLCGWTSDCWIYNSVVQASAGAVNGPYGPIMKGTTGGFVWGNLVINPGHTGLLAKGGSEWSGGVGPQFWNNTVLWTINPSAAAICLGQVADESGAPVTGAVFNNNICSYSFSGSNANRFVSQTGTGNTSTFSNNNYYAQGTTTGSGWQYSGTFYSTLAAWKAAVEASALGVVPNFVYTSSTPYNLALNGNSALVSAGTATVSPVTTDPAGNTYYAVPSVGAYQYTGPQISGMSFPVPRALMSTQSGNYAGGTSQYRPVVGLVSTTLSSENGASQIMPLAGTLSGLTAIVGTAPGTGNSVTVTVRDNYASTALTCTISGSATSCVDNTHTVSVAANDLLDVMDVPSASAAASKIKSSVVITQ
jgi:hypothetical protein